MVLENVPKAYGGINKFKFGRLVRFSDNSLFLGLGAAGASDDPLKLIHSTSTELADKAEDAEVVHLAGTEEITGDKDFTGALTKDGYKLMRQLVSNQTVTVGSGGDFASLQDAFDYAAMFRPVGGAILTVNILTGTTISGTVTLTGGDYSHVRLTSTDAAVTISSTADFFTLNDCVGPRIDIVFDKNSTAGNGFVLRRSRLFLKASLQAPVRRCRQCSRSLSRRTGTHC